MTKNDATQDLADGFEPGPLPPMGPDGGMTAGEPVKVSDPPPRICEQGPCVHYHRFEILMDATKPIAAEVGEDGRPRGIAPDVRHHVEVHHYCYPTVGVETKLGSLPMLHCNFWEPKLKAKQDALELTRAEYLESEDGKRYLGELAAWEERQQAELEREAAVAEDAAKVLAEAAAARDASAQGPIVIATEVATGNETDTPPTAAIEGEPKP